MKLLPRLVFTACLAGATLPSSLPAATPEDSTAQSSEKKSGKKKKKKNRDQAAAAEASGGAAAPAETAAAGGSKDATVAAAPAEQTNNGDWCAWLQDKPGLLYENKKNPWIQSFDIGGRFHYQVAYVDGEDVNGREFDDTYDEYRRFRFETKTEFLQFLTAEVNVNLVSDNRFRNSAANELEWGYDRFDEASIQIDIDKALGTGGPFDDIKLKYGRMKLKMTEEVHMSSNSIYTIERSHLSDKLGGDASRPTGVTLELDRGNWQLLTGIFSAEDDADFIGGWNSGQFYYGSLRWKATEELKFLLDYSQNDQHGVDDALGYGWATAFSVVYEKKNWGAIVETMYGDNGGSNGLIARRQGDFHGFVIMPWYWIVEDKLQAVVQYQYANSETSQGLRLSSRYIREQHDDTLVDVDGGRGNELNSLYGGLNYHICRDRLKVMGGVSWDDLSTRSSDLHAVTWQLAFRAAF